MKKRLVALEDKIKIVLKDMRTRFPKCPHSITINLWDDGTDRVVCRYGTEDSLYLSTYYKDQLSFEEYDMRRRPGPMLADEKGNEYLIINKLK